MIFIFFILKALSFLKISKFLSCLFGHVEKNGLIGKIKSDFKIYDVTTWLKNNCNADIAQYLTR